jgi:hypothetical protein
MKARDITGHRFERLVAMERKPRRADSGRMRTFWLCQCDCGITTEVDLDALLKGNTRSCGCLQRGPMTPCACVEAGAEAVWRKRWSRFQGDLTWPDDATATEQRVAREAALTVIQSLRPLCLRCGEDRLEVARPKRPTHPSRPASKEGL